jgi:hypothetical protein
MKETKMDINAILDFDKDSTLESRTQHISTFFKEHKNVLVKFTKVDGSLREMPSTLHESLIPDLKTDWAPDESKKKTNPNVMSVYCTDADGWRSFRLENVISVTGYDS